MVYISNAIYIPGLCMRYEKVVFIFRKLGHPRVNTRYSKGRAHIPQESLFSRFDLSHRGRSS